MANFPVIEHAAQDLPDCAINATAGCVTVKRKSWRADSSQAVRGSGYGEIRKTYLSGLKLLNKRRNWKGTNRVGAPSECSTGYSPRHGYPRSE